VPAWPPGLVLCIGVVAISTGAIFVRFAEAPALVIAAYRVGLATLVLLLLAARQTREAWRTLTPAEIGYSVGAGGFLALHFATWITSLQYTSVASSVTLVNTHPLWVGLALCCLGRERLRWLTLGSMALGVTGGAILGIDDRAAEEHDLWGHGLAVLGGLCTAGYLLLGRQVRPKLALLAYVTLCYGTAAVFLWLVVLIGQLPVTGFPLTTYGALLAMALIPQLIGHSSYNWALRWLNPGVVALSLLGEPVGSALLAYLILGEVLTWTTVLGGVCVLSAIGLAAWSER